MGAVSNGLYNLIFRRNYIFMSTVFVGAFAFEMYGNPAEDVQQDIDIRRAFDTGSDAIWNSLNRGRRWADIKHRYMQAPESEDDDE